MNKLDIALIVAIVVIVAGAGGYAAYSGITENIQPQVQAQLQNTTCNSLNCTVANCQKINCTGNCTAEGNGKHQRNRNRANT